jgi:hypothetical protein
MRSKIRTPAWWSRAPRFLAHDLVGIGDKAFRLSWRGKTRQDLSISVSHFDNHREMVGKSLPITQSCLFVRQSKAMRIEKPSSADDVKIVSRHWR